MGRACEPGAPGKRWTTHAYAWSDWLRAHAALRFAVIACVLLSLGSCADPESARPIRVAFNTWPGYEFIYLARVKGFYEEQGVPIKLVELNSLADVRRAFERGQVDIMASTMVEALIAAENSGRAIEIIAVTDASNGGDMLLARPPIADVGALRGKRIGMEGATVDVLVVAAALDRAGLSFRDIQVVNKAQDDLVIAIEAGEIDAIETYPPYAVRLTKNGRYNKVFDTARIPGEVLDILAVDATTLVTRRKEVRRFLRAYFAAVDDFRANPAAASVVAGAREGLSGPEFLAAISAITVFGRDDQEAYLGEAGKGRQALQRTSEALVATGWLQAAPDVAAFFEPAGPVGR